MPHIRKDTQVYRTEYLSWRDPAMHFIGKHCRVIDSSTTTFWGESIPKTQLSFIFPSGRIETQYLLMSSKPLSVRTLPVKYKVSFREYVLHHAKRIGRVHAANT